MMKKRDLRFLSKMIYFCGSDHILNLLDDKDKENRIKEYNNYKKIKDKGLKLSLTSSGLFSLGVFILTIISSFGIFASFLALAISFFITYSLAEEFYKFVEAHWGKESVFNPESYKAEKKSQAAKMSRTRKARLATEQ